MATMPPLGLPSRADEMIGAGDAIGAIVWRAILGTSLFLSIDNEEGPASRDAGPCFHTIAML
jgi:hypothetical protein